VAAIPSLKVYTKNWLASSEEWTLERTV